MTPEVPKPEGEQQLDPVQEARRAFNRELLGGDYSGSKLVLRNLQLQNALLSEGGTLADERLYQELRIATNQCIERAELQNDLDTVLILKELQQSIETNHDNSTSVSTERSQTSAETRTHAGIPTQCQHCNYEWSYKGRLSKASCPSCGQKTPPGIIHRPEFN